MKKTLLIALFIALSVSCLFAEGTKIAIGGVYDRTSLGGSSSKFTGTGIGAFLDADFNLKKNDNIVIFTDFSLALPKQITVNGTNYKWSNFENSLVKSRLDLKAKIGVKYAFQYMLNGSLDLCIGGGLLVDYVKFRVLDTSSVDVNFKSIGAGVAVVGDVDFFFSNHVGIRLQGAADMNVFNYSLSEKKFSMGIDFGYTFSAGLLINLYK